MDTSPKTGLSSTAGRLSERKLKEVFFIRQSDALRVSMHVCRHFITVLLVTHDDQRRFYITCHKLKSSLCVL